MTSDFRPIPISDLLPAEIAEALRLDPPYRGKQIFKGHHKHLLSFEHMTDLPLRLREELGTRATLFTGSVLESIGDGKGATKLRIKLKDGYVIEEVVLEDEAARKTACLSSQAGCAMGCAFCRTGTLGFTRNLKAYEIVEQFLQARIMNPDIGNIVFMGMGEPLHNIDNLIKAAIILHEPDGANVGYGRVTVSTCGIAEGIERLAHEAPRMGLALSLITSSQSKRETLLPSARTNPLPLLKTKLELYQRLKGGRITLEYVLLRDINDSPDEVRGLTDFCRGLDCLLNLIPYNPVRGLPYRTPEPDGVRRFADSLEKAGLRVTRRMARGRGIRSACGQLGGPLI